MGFIEQNWFRHIATLMIAVMLVVGFTPRVEAGFVPSTEVYKSFDRTADMQGVQKVLENKMVAKRLQDFGYTKAEIDDRLAQLSDAEMHELATNIQDVDTGSGAFGFVIGVLVIVILVIVILKLTDKTVTVS